ncbi:hypothetical protein F2Q69_00044697 [Brassica cretica]|uniref:Uncharacterized protein n=1 Tax=Brassica cretica TaxID=69181 RepID=A0A8S9NIY5_BRACR|nr:hypothetical protein F2Q69_00044697 [Brassica cretica]
MYPSFNELLCVVSAESPYPASSSNKNKFKTQRKSEREVTSVVTSGGSGDYGEDGDWQKWI